MRPGRLPRGVCAQCGRCVALRVNGVVREHPSYESGGICMGSGKRPLGREVAS